MEKHNQLNNTSWLSNASEKQHVGAPQLFERHSPKIFGCAKHTIFLKSAEKACRQRNMVKQLFSNPIFQFSNIGAAYDYALRYFHTQINHYPVTKP
jgi:hypothetical protein